MKGIRELLRRLRERRGAHQQPQISLDAPDLQVVVQAFDETEAASAVLARAARWQPKKAAVLRHHLLLPSPQVESARNLLEPDNWALRPGGQGDQIEEIGQAPVVAQRIQQLDALHCSQESSRMAGLAQRLGGHALGWDALQPVSALD